MTTACFLLLALAIGPQSAFDQQATGEPAPAEEPAVERFEPVVVATLEELRKAELMLAADEMAPLLAHSFTQVSGTSRISGAFAYLEPMRRLRARKGAVKELAFSDVVVRVYGASAVASYRYRKTTVDQGGRKTEQGWATDVFERRDDGAWILVHRHRG